MDNKTQAEKLRNFLIRIPLHIELPEFEIVDDDEIVFTWKELNGLSAVVSLSTELGNGYAMLFGDKWEAGIYDLDEHVIWDSIDLYNYLGKYTDENRATTRNHEEDL